MYPTVQFIHSYWAYLVLIVLFVAVINSIIGYASNKQYGSTNFRIALFTLITTHIQLLIGIVLYFVSPYFSVLPCSSKYMFFEADKGAFSLKSRLPISPLDCL